jgi:pimeloyl-ACP methyl ester carboxylesterase
MAYAQSADGTDISYSRVGEGPAVIIVNGAMSTAADAAPLADALARAGFTAVSYDRRARGDSGDARDSLPEREVEDLAAVVEVAGGDAAVLGHSSGAVLALYAAARGVPARHLFLSEPPFHFGVGEPAPDLPERLQGLVDADRLDEAITAFQLEGVGLPPQMVQQIRDSPMFPALLPLAQSVVYDARLTRALSAPTDDMLAVRAPVSILLGAQTFPLLDAAARRLAELLPEAELVEVPESIGHRADPEATARIVAERMPAA